MDKRKIAPPETWKDLNTHYLKILNNEWYRLLVELEDLINVETYRFYQKKKMKSMHLPITTGTISSPMGKGSDSLPVKINLEGIDTYLADSMQFMLEYGCRLTSKGCYYIMPTFRGEKADERHLCQFYHSEAEIIGSLSDVMLLVEEYIKYLSKKIIKKLGSRLKKDIGDISHLEEVASNEFHFKHMTFDEAENYFKKRFPNSFEKYILYKDGWRDLSREAEEELVKEFKVIWISNYDSLTVPFYQALDPMDNTKALNADLLMGIGEVVGCGQRHTNYEEVYKSLIKHEVSEKEYKWYIDLKKHYPLLTSGFGLGTERFLMWVLKDNDIRNFQLCPRFNGERIVQ